MSMKRDMKALRDPKLPAAAPSPLHLIVACEERLEEALYFLVQALDDKPRAGKKPVIMHSLRVAWRLLEQRASTDVVTAGLLHDLLEKSSVTHAQISRRFGAEVGLMVTAATNDLRISDPLKRYADSVSRCARLGEGALMVRAADLIDNCDRLMVLDSPIRLARVAEKLRMLLRTCRDEQVDGEMVEELARRFRRLNRKVAGLALVPKRHPAVAKAARLSSRHR